MMNFCSRQYYSLWSERLREVEWSRMVPQAIGGEEELKVTSIQSVYLGEPWYLIIHND